MLSEDYVNYEDYDSDQKAQKQMEKEFGSNKERNPPPAPSYNRHQTRTSSSSSAVHHHHHNRHDAQKNEPSSRKNHRHQKHHHQQKKDKNETKELLEKRHKKYAKEKYQRKLERAQKMQLQREHKLEYQSRQLAELERQHQARQKVYFGNFAEENKQFDSIADIDQHLEGAGGVSHQDRYPNLARLQSQLKEDRDKDLPPYVRKYNRRNKQLFDLIEGTNSPDSLASSSSHAGGGGQRKKQHHHHHHHHNHPGTSSSGPSVDHLSHKEKIERWIAENLFEEQRRNPNQIVQPPPEDPELLLDSKINALPGELGSDDVAGHLMEDGKGGGEAGSGPVANVNTNRLSQTRAGNFVYHRIAQSQPSNAIGQGAPGAAYGVIVRKPGLPFVAITDRRQEHNKPKHV